MSTDVWSEKYRPQRLDEMVGDPKVLEKLKSYVATKNVQSMLFVGPSGVGKTTAARCIVNEIYGYEKYPHTEVIAGFHYECNAADLSKDEVRNKIKNMALFMPVYSTAPVEYRMCIIDECEKMSADVETLLRKIIEDYSKSIRFIFICNEIVRKRGGPSHPSEPIQSRCIKIEFEKISKEYAIKRLKVIMAKENIILSDSELEKVFQPDEVWIGKGIDLRHAINELQSIAEPMVKPKVPLKRTGYKCVSLKLLHSDLVVPERYHKRELRLDIQESLKVRPCECDKIEGKHYKIWDGRHRFNVMKKRKEERTEVKVYYGYSDREILKMVGVMIGDSLTPIDACRFLEALWEKGKYVGKRELAKDQNMKFSAVSQRLKAAKLCRYVDKTELSKRIPKKFSKLRELSRLIRKEVIRRAGKDRIKQELNEVIKQITPETAYDEVKRMVDMALWKLGLLPPKKYPPPPPRVQPPIQDFWNFPLPIETIINRLAKKHNMSKTAYVTRFIIRSFMKSSEDLKKREKEFKEWFEKEFEDEDAKW